MRRSACAPALTLSLFSGDEDDAPILHTNGVKPAVAKKRKKVASPESICADIAALLGRMEGFDDKAEAVNVIRRALHESSPFKDNPVDLVQWVKGDLVTANDYNPNSVAPPEMELLRLSIEADGYTQPIVANWEGGINVVVDGFHRNRVGKECEEVRAMLHGYLPVVQIRSAQTDTPDRMASTVRHNRARGKHRVDAMSDIVIELKRRNWSDAKISKQLGMDADEVLRLTQITGIAELFSNEEFSKAWDIDTISEAEALLDSPEVDI